LFDHEISLGLKPKLRLQEIRSATPLWIQTAGMTFNHQGCSNSTAARFPRGVPAGMRFHVHGQLWVTVNERYALVRISAAGEQKDVATIDAIRQSGLPRWRFV
jgi:hypothetical protein